VDEEKRDPIEHVPIRDLKVDPTLGDHSNPANDVHLKTGQRS
jgi:hypothetical protein